jgi:hypothetical protein
MSELAITSQVMEAFYAVLEKEAGMSGAALTHLTRPGTMHAVQAGLGTGLGLGLLGGGVAGAASEGKRQYDMARQNGQGVLGAARHGAGGALVGALHGAGKGALIGAGAGALAGAAAPTQLLRGTRAISQVKNPLGDAANFGQRQVHGFTGWRPGGAVKSIEQIGGGAAEARGALGKALQGGDAAAIGKAQGTLSAAEKAQAMGLTSLPGVAKSVKDNGLLPTVATGAKEQWSGSSKKMKALMVGLPAASVVNTLRKGETEGGKGKGERIGRTLGGALGYSMAPLSLGAGTALGMGLERAGGLVGKGVDKLRGKRPDVPQAPSPPPATEPGDTGQHLAERVYGTGFTGSLE